MLRDPSLIPLSHDHQHALALCVRIRRELGGGAEAASGVQKLAESVIAHFESEMRGHFECEESVLFPVLANVEETRALTAELRAEHRNLVGLVERMRSEPDAGLLEAFAEMLTQHVRKEERVLFEEAQRLLSRDEMNAIGSAVLAGRITGGSA